MKKVLYLLAAFAIVIAAACSKKDACATTDPIGELQKIRAYIAAKGWTAQVITPDSVYYVIDTPGSGTNPNVSSNVTVNYKGYLLDGTVFDQSTTPATFSLSGVIKGWTVGFPKFKRGGKGKLLIPSAAGYGTTTTGSIPCNSVLIFEIELINF